MVKDEATKFVGKDDEAELLYERSQAILEKLGSGHPNVASPVGIRAGLSRRQGKTQHREDAVTAKKDITAGAKPGLKANSARQVEYSKAEIDRAASGTTHNSHSWLRSCGDIDTGVRTPIDGVPLLLHSVSRLAVDGSARVVQSLPGERAGYGILCHRWRDKNGQVEVKVAPQDHKKLEEVRLLDDMYMNEVQHRGQTGTCLINPVVRGPAGITFSPNTASISYYLGRYDLLVQTEGDHGGKEGMERHLCDKYFPVVKGNGPAQHWKTDSSVTVVWKPGRAVCGSRKAGHSEGDDEVWLETEVEGFSDRGLARFWGWLDCRSASAVSINAAPASGTASPPSTPSRSQQVPLGSQLYPYGCIGVWNKTRVPLQVMLVPETFLAVVARGRSREAHAELQVMGHELRAGGATSMSDSVSQQLTSIFTTSTRTMILPSDKPRELQLPGSVQCRLLWFSVSAPFEPSGMDRAEELMVEGHGYDKMIARGPLTTKYYFRERDPPHREHRSLLSIRVWEKSSIAPQGYSEMTQSVLDAPCVLDVSVPCTQDIERTLIARTMAIQNVHAPLE